MSKAAKLTVEKLVKTLKKYDAVKGEYPEHALEGRAVGVFVLQELGYPDRYIARLLKIEKDSRWQYFN